jgi:hypothetical protein
MKTFKVTNSNSSLFLQVKTDTVKKAFTKVYHTIGEDRVKPHLVVSEIYENGSIDLDSKGKIQWKYIDSIGKFLGHGLEFITIIDNLPKDCDTSEKVKKYILENVRINYKLKEDNNITEFKLDEGDDIKLLVERTGIIIKKINIQ